MKLIECPRDAWQGRTRFIPTQQKIAYLNQLLHLGFDTLDCGSFVSAKAIPQVADTATLIDQLNLDETSTKLLTIVANERGSAEACSFEKVSYLGYPFSISETFQRRNTNATIAESFQRVEKIAEMCNTHGKELVIYISMGFGNPYGDTWDPDVILYWVERLAGLGIRIFSLADTVGLANPNDISAVFSSIIPAMPGLEFGAHFHTQPNLWRLKIDAAYNAGCRRFDGAILGYGGCPMAQDELIGNMPTEKLIKYALEKQELPQIDPVRLDQAKKKFLELVHD
jgi:hydroxymethylglutaryl-CoA lyase